ncbi:MAG: T9SS type A sorting domain-containing protein [Saprospiraceae bacterium]
MVKARTNIGASEFQVQRHPLPPGTYVVKVVFEEGVVSEKVMFR